MVQAPTGTVTLVFTDIEGSTVLWEYFGEGFMALLDQHNALFREAITELGGYEVQTMGDAFIIAFQEAAPAVAMCLVMQERLHAAEWPESLNDETVVELSGTTEDGSFRGLRVRMGVHTGRPDCQPDPVTGRMDYFGSMVNRAARVCGVSHGGQLVVSRATWEAVGGGKQWSRLPGGTVVVDLGGHALPGLEGQEQLRQLLPASLSSRILPRLKTPSMKKTNLPTRVDSFFGREPELLELGQRVAGGQRLITVLGAGGTGKTRLSQHFGGTQLGEFPGGVWFCDLTQSRGRSGILSAMGVALEVPLTGRDPEAQLAEAILGRGRVLVILDNFEQVVDQATDTLGRWLQGAPEAVFMVTSRALLRIAGEEVFTLDPLPAAEAMNLFYDRARAVRPDFERTGDNEPVVTEIVERLDGMSLAVELAAARVRMLSPEKILSRLSERFKLLRGQRRDQSARQATLRGAIDWSWELLKPHEQSALSQLSVFRGGGTLEAAEAVVDLERFEDELWVLDVVESLVDHSLLRREEPHRGHVRYRMLESIREYAAEKQGEQAEATSLRHGSHFASLGQEDFLESLHTHGGMERRKNLALELENLLAGVDAGLVAGALEGAAGCALAAAEVFFLHGPFSDGIALLERVSGQPVSPATEARLFYMTGWLLQLAGRPAESLQHHQKALAIHRELGNRRGEGRILGNLASHHHNQGRIEEALAHYHQALPIHREVGNRRGEASTLANLASLHHEQGHIPEALEHYHQALAIARETGNRRHEAITLGNLANLHRDQGRIQEALEHYHQALPIHRDVGDHPGEGIALGNLGDLLFDQGDLGAAETHFQQAIAIIEELFPIAAGAFRGSLALIRAHQGDFDKARSLLGRGEPQLRGTHALELGKLLCKKARVEHLAGDSSAAAAALAEAETVAIEMGASLDSELTHTLAEARKILAG